MYYFLLLSSVNKAFKTFQENLYGIAVTWVIFANIEHNSVSFEIGHSFSTRNSF